LFHDDIQELPQYCVLAMI